MNIRLILVATIFFVIKNLEGRFLLVKVNDGVGPANLLEKDQSNHGNYNV